MQGESGAYRQAMPCCQQEIQVLFDPYKPLRTKFDEDCRDIEFDLEKDQRLCQYGLFGNKENEPSVKRVTEIFDKPVFFGPDGPNASDVRQGDLGDCWFLAALSAVSTVPGLVEKFCVAVSIYVISKYFSLIFLSNQRDEEVGVYGFIFFRDCYWQPVIIDE